MKSKLPTTKELSREAIKVSKELVNPVFVGAVGVYLHTMTNRKTSDLDLVVAKEIPDEEFLDKQYRIIHERRKDRKYTPRNYKVDIFTNDVNEIPVSTIIRTAVDKKGIKVASLEALVVTKCRTSRSQDTEDLKYIAETKYSVIDWEKVRMLVNDEHEFDMIKMSINALHNPTQPRR